MNNAFQYRSSYFNLPFNGTLAAAILALIGIIAVPVLLFFSAILGAGLWLYVRAKRWWKQTQQHMARPTVTINNQPGKRDLRDAEYIEYEIVE